MLYKQLLFYIIYRTKVRGKSPYLLSAGTNISTISRLQWVGSTDAELANMKV
jgi:hypothetical protein